MKTERDPTFPADGSDDIPLSEPHATGLLIFREAALDCWPRRSGRDRTEQ
jgi:hypothetical protein